LTTWTKEARNGALEAPLLSIGRAAHSMYSEGKSTAVEENFFADRSLLTEIGGVPGALEAGFFVRDGGLVRFRHQLFHDWAVANYYLQTRAILASTELRRDLDSATLLRQSTDALEFLVQMNARRSQADAEKVVLNIYDWDYPSAVTSLLSWMNVASPGGPIPQPSDHITITTLSLIAEKQFDLFQHTVQRFVRIRSLVDPVLIRLLSLPENYSLSDLVQAVGNSIPRGLTPSWYGAWVSAFSQVMPFLELLQLLQSYEGALGWTASNVLARDSLNEDQLREIVDLFDSLAGEVGSSDHAATVRWRLVHSVGRSPLAGPFLSDVARNSTFEDDVRYGAVRSLCSLALGRDGDSAQSSLHLVEALDAGGFLNRPRIADAIRRCCIPAESVSPWSTDIWYVAFQHMLVSHTEELRATGSGAVAAWTLRLEELGAWHEAGGDNEH
jgi:hypothetical protein